MIITTYQIIDKISLQTNFIISKYILYADTTLSLCQGMEYAKVKTCKQID